MGRNDQVVLLVDPVQLEILLVPGGFEVIFIVQPETDLDDVVCNHLTLGRRPHAAREHVNAPAHQRAGGDRTANTVGNDLAPFAHGVFGQLAVAFHAAVFAHEFDRRVGMVDNRRGVAARLHLHRLDAAVGGDAARNVVVAPHVVAVGGNVDRNRWNDDRRLAELFNETPFGRIAQIRRGHDDVGIALRRALVNPGDDGVDIFLGQSPVALQFLDTDAVVRRRRAASRDSQP